MVLELMLPDDMPATPLLELQAPEFVIVGAILRDQEVIIPKGSDELRGKDRVLLFCTREYEEEARNFFLCRKP